MHLKTNSILKIVEAPPYEITVRIPSAAPLPEDESRDSQPPQRVIVGTSSLPTGVAVRLS